MKRWAWWWGVGVVLAAVLAAPLARAQSGIALDGKKVSGIYMSGLLWWPGDSTIRIPRSDQFGNLLTVDPFRDRDFSVITTLLGPVQELGPAQTVQMAQAIPVPQYGHGVLLLSYTTQVPGDSDSVNVSIKVYSTTSGNSANLCLFTPYSDTTGLAGDVAPDSSVAGAVTRGGFRPSYYITRNRYTALSVGKGTVTVAIPPPCYRYASPSGAAIVLSDQNGEAPRFDYILLSITNNNPRRSIKNVEIDFWPKVN